MYNYYTMLCSLENGVVCDKDKSSDISLLEQEFTQLPPEGRNYLKKYLQNLVSLQNMAVGADNTGSLSDGKKGGQ